MPEWTAMIVYTIPDDTVDDIWTKAGLISARNFEAKALTDPNYLKSCVADPVPGGAEDEVACNTDKSLLTPLSLFTDPNNLENMTEQQIKKVLTDALANPITWQFYAAFFGNEVTVASPKVKYMRSLTYH